MRSKQFTLLSLFGLAMLGAACADDAIDFGDVGLEGQDGSSLDSGDGQDTGSGVGVLELPSTVSVSDDGVLMCGAAPCQCNNGVDDDGDGVIDGFDAECTGALDDEEASFATGMPGDNRDPKWQDCFFDGNSGAGDDRCRYPTGCLTGDIDPSDPRCATTEACRNNCQPLAPNGCDCFGCCEVQLPSGESVNVTLSDSCSLATIGDPEACQPCTKSTSCGNECGECELCPGRTAADLPESCNTPPPAPEPETPPAPPAEPEEPPPSEPPPSEPPPAEPPPPAPTCEGFTSCSAQSDCAMDQFCSMGCCIAVIR